MSSAAELAGACAQEFPACDVLIMAAAVADFRPAAPAEGKIKRAGRERLELTLEPTDDVLASLVGLRRGWADARRVRRRAWARAVALGREKLLEKGVDVLVVNDISRADIGFDADANEVTMLASAGGADTEAPCRARRQGAGGRGGSSTRSSDCARGS